MLWHEIDAEYAKQLVCVNRSLTMFLHNSQLAVASDLSEEPGHGLMSQFYPKAVIGVQLERSLWCICTRGRLKLTKWRH
jgi:hypothetical protein